MRGAIGLLNVARASFELDSAEETPSLTRELQRSRGVFPRGENGQPAGLTLRHIAESARGLFRALRSEVTVRGGFVRTSRKTRHVAEISSAAAGGHPCGSGSR